MFMTLYALFAAPISPPATESPITLEAVSEDELLLPECGICYDQMNVTLVYECSACQAAFCTSCMRSFITSKVQDGLFSSQHLVCPAAGCLSEDLVEAFSDAPQEPDGRHPILSS